MFTGIVQGTAVILAVRDTIGLRTFQLEFSESFCADLALGASVSVDGVCLTVTNIFSPSVIEFDVVQQSLTVTTLNRYQVGLRVNVERAAKDGAEIGGHPLSGHIDFSVPIAAIRESENNKVWRINVPEQWRKYIFAKGYIAINGASLTIAEANREHGWFEVWLIPETRRTTVFEEKRVGDFINVEIERGTQVVVDTVRDAVAENLGNLQPLLEAFLKEKGISLDELVSPPRLRLTDGHKN